MRPQRGLGCSHAAKRCSSSSCFRRSTPAGRSRRRQQLAAAELAAGGPRAGQGPTPLRCSARTSRWYAVRGSARVSRDAQRHRPPGDLARRISDARGAAHDARGMTIGPDDGNGPHNIAPEAADRSRTSLGFPCPVGPGQEIAPRRSRVRATLPNGRDIAAELPRDRWRASCCSRGLFVEGDTPPSRRDGRRAPGRSAPTGRSTTRAWRLPSDDPDHVPLDADLRAGSDRGRAQLPAGHRCAVYRAQGRRYDRSQRRRRSDARLLHRWVDGQGDPCPGGAEAPRASRRRATLRDIRWPTS